MTTPQSCFLVVLNRTGLAGEREIGIEFWKPSFVADTRCEILYRIPVQQAARDVVMLNLDMVDGRQDRLSMLSCRLTKHH